MTLAMKPSKLITPVAIATCQPPYRGGGGVTATYLTFGVAYSTQYLWCSLLNPVRTAAKISGAGGSPLNQLHK